MSPLTQGLNYRSACDVMFLFFSGLTLFLGWLSAVWRRCCRKKYWKGCQLSVVQQI